MSYICVCPKRTIFLLLQTWFKNPLPSGFTDFTSSFYFFQLRRKVDRILTDKLIKRNGSDDSNTELTVQEKKRSFSLSFFYISWEDNLTEKFKSNSGRHSSWQGPRHTSVSCRGRGPSDPNSPDWRSRLPVRYPIHENVTTYVSRLIHSGKMDPIHFERSPSIKT